MESDAEKASTQPTTVWRVALQELADALDPGVHRSAPRLGELPVRRALDGLGEEAVRAHRVEDGGELRRRDGAPRLWQLLADHHSEQTWLEPLVVQVRKEADGAGHRWLLVVGGGGFWRRAGRRRGRTWGGGGAGGPLEGETEEGGGCGAGLGRAKP